MEFYNFFFVILIYLNLDLLCKALSICLAVSIRSLTCCKNETVMFSRQFDIQSDEIEGGTR